MSNTICLTITDEAKKHLAKAKNKSKLISMLICDFYKQMENSEKQKISPEINNEIKEVLG